MHPIPAAYCRAYQLIFRAAMPLLPYREPRLLPDYKAVADLLNRRGISTVLMITDKSIRSLGLTKPMEQALTAAGIDCAIYDGVVPNPTINNIEAARRLYIHAKAGAILAVGGGSVMDCAKVTGARIVRPGKPVSKMRGLFQVLRRTPLTIVVPTTAGTGSEATVAAVITDPETHAKYPINDFALIPDAAVLDPEITRGLPPSVTATTGMDALTHAVEAYIGRSTTKQTRSLSEKAVKLIAQNLKRAYEDGNDLEARRNMLQAAYWAGMSFTRSYVGYVHGIAHSLGGRYGTAHGLANAVILPYFLEEYGVSCERQLASLARAADLAPADMSDRKAAAVFRRWVRKMNADMGIPEFLPEIREEDIPMMAKAAGRESNPLYPVPALMTTHELEGMYHRLIPPEKQPELDAAAITSLLADQRAFFAAGSTMSAQARLAALTRLRKSIRRHERDINRALKADLNKSPVESYMCEVGMTLSELSHTITHLRGWMRPRGVPTPLAHFPARSFTMREPYGVVLVMSPWNYPFMLTMEPLIGAIAAGNCCVVKTSPDSPATTEIIRRIISECFRPEQVSVLSGGLSESRALLEQDFDYIFYTGGPAVGREVMRKAAEHLTPVTLELGGKSPCIVDSTAKLDLAAKRLAFGKLLNCGQTCVAPDYLLIDKRVKDRFLKLVQKWMVRMYGKDPLSNDGYVRMINRRHFDRVNALIDPAKAVFGGQSDPDTLRIQPTILDNVSPDDPVMQEEIFGPVLPVITYETLDEAIAFVNARPHPLALYLFSESKSAQKKVLTRIPFGGGCLNDTIVHLATSAMPFGGVGGSGMGSYHGRKSFETFTHEKSILDKSTTIDLPVRYAPYSAPQGALLKLFLR